MSTRENWNAFVEPQVGFGQAQNFWLSRRTRARATMDMPWAYRSYSLMLCTFELLCVGSSSPMKGDATQVEVDKLKFVRVWWKCWSICLFRHVKEPGEWRTHLILYLSRCKTFGSVRRSLLTVFFFSVFCPISVRQAFFWFVVYPQCKSSTPFSARIIGWCLIVCSVFRQSLCCVPTRVSKSA